MSLDLIHYFIIGFLVILPILYELNSTFRYYAKFTLYYFIIMAIATVVCFYGVFKPGDVDNHWFIIWSFSQVKKLFGIEIEVRGRENLETDESYILVINHQSSIDLIGMFEVWPIRGACMIKKELQYAGPFGAGATLCGSVFVDRFNHDKAIDTMKSTIDKIEKQKLRVVVFPEGTRNHKGSMMPFKKGAFHLAVQAQIPVVPVVFSAYTEFYSKRDKRFTTGKFIATILPKFSTKGLTAKDVPDLADRVRQVMLDTFNQASLENTQTKLANKTANGAK